ncbi:MAG: PilZ domain-containing protein, partial [Myxococcota bacterium]
MAATDVPTHDPAGQRGSAIERREIHRLPCRIIIAKHGHSSPLGIVSNISLDGLFVATAEPLPRGAVVPLSFQLTDGNKPLVAEAEVVRVAEAGMGLRFLRMAPRDRRRLRRFVVELTTVIGHRETIAQLHGTSAIVTA